MAIDTNTNTIYKPANGSISVAEVAQFIGVQPRSLGYHLSDVCTSSHIKPFAKYKPVIYPTYRTDTIANWWKGTNGLCGFAPVQDEYAVNNIFDDLSVLVSRFMAGNYIAWVYQPPTGGSAAPYRLLDFDGYCHSAVSPAGNITVGTYGYVSWDDRVTLILQYPSISNAGNLQMSDFSGIGTQGGTPVNFSTCYPGIVLINGNKWIAGTASSTFGALLYGEDTDVVFHGIGDFLGQTSKTTFTAVPFISSVNLSDTTDFPDGVNSDNYDDLVAEQGFEGFFTSSLGTGASTIYVKNGYDMQIASYDDEWDVNGATITANITISDVDGSYFSISRPSIYAVPNADWQRYVAGTLTAQGLESLYSAVSTNLTSPITATGDYDIDNLSFPVDTELTPLYSDDWRLVLVYTDTSGTRKAVRSSTTIEIV